MSEEFKVSSVKKDSNKPIVKSSQIVKNGSYQPREVKRSGCGCGRNKKG